MAISLTALSTAFKSAVQNNLTAVRSTASVLSVLAVYEIVEIEGFFQCPLKNHALYGSCFLILPALLLSCVTIFFHNGFWMTVRGCCYYGEDEKQGGKRWLPCLYPRWVQCSKNLAYILIESCLSGFIWIIWAFLQRDCYICIVLGGGKETKLNNATHSQKLQIEADYTNAGTYSQNVGVWLLVSLLVVIFIDRSRRRCCLGQPQADDYVELELETATANA